MELRTRDIKIIKPDVNISKEDFTIENNSLILPLIMIKGITKDISENIVKNQPYNDIFKFLSLNKNLNRKIMETLIYAGSLNNLGYNINTLIQNLDVLLTYVELGIEDDSLKPIIKKYPEYDDSVIRDKELELFGYYVSNHPSSKYQDKNIMKMKNIDSNLFKNVTIIVIINSIKTLKTKKGDDMAFIIVSDETGSAETVIFQDNFKDLNGINKNDLVLIKGKVSKSFDKTRIIINNIIKEKDRKL